MGEIKDKVLLHAPVGASRSNLISPPSAQLGDGSIACLRRRLSRTSGRHRGSLPGFIHGSVGAVALDCRQPGQIPVTGCQELCRGLND